MLKHTSRNYLKPILIFTSIFLIAFTQYSSILQFEKSNSSNLPIELEFKAEELTEIKNKTPQAALEYLIFENDPLLFVIDEKGYISNDWTNLWYSSDFHHFYWMSYLSINDGPVRAFEDFLVVKSLTPLTEFIDGDFTKQLVAESIIQHPTEEVYVKIQIKLYPNEEFFVMTCYIWSETIEIDKAELFFFNDLDVDGYVWDDVANFDTTTELIYASDKAIHTSMGWVSPHPIASFDVGVPDDVEGNVISDSLTENDYIFNNDVGIATKYQDNSISVNEPWVVPLIYGFALSESGIYSTTVDVKDQFIDDFSVLDFTVNLTEGPDNPSLEASILNGGQSRSIRNVSVFRNGTYLQSQEIDLLPGEKGNVEFINLLLIPGAYNEITVSVNSSVNDYEPNNYISHTYLTYEDYRINFKDLDGFDINGLNISLYQQATQTLINSQFTDEYGNVTYTNLIENDYTLKAFAPWANNHLIYEENFTFILHDQNHQVQTNMTTLVLQILDVANFPVINASINITKDEFMWNDITDENGNVTFYFLNQTYDIAVSYYDYETTLSFDPIIDLGLTEKTYYTHQVSLTNLTFHLKTSLSQENLTGAQVEFYERINSTSFGNIIGFELSDSDGNVSIQWSSLLNYSIRVSFFSEYKPIGDTEAEALNFTDSPYDVHIFQDINVSLEGTTLDEYSTEIVLFNSPPPLISYIWGENLDFQFMLNVSGPNFEGPKYADETFITIRNQKYEIVYDGNATSITDQVGNHSFTVNSSSGYFTSDTPETYTVNVFAQIYGYNDPTPVIFSFNIYNISTNMVLHTSSADVYWKENFTITTDYFDIINSRWIIDGHATVTWGNNLIDYPMQNLGNGTYTLEIDTSIGIPENTVVNVKCSRDNYITQESKFNLNVREIPTSVNGSILFDSRHSQFVSTLNLTLEYNFIDSYRNSSIPDLSPMYQLIQSETDEVYTGFLTYSENSCYIFDPTSAQLQIGTYHGLIEFSQEHYISSYASVQIEVFPIPTSLNDTTISEIPYEINCYSSFTLDLQYLNSFQGGTVNNANASYLVSDYYSDENFTGELNEISDGLYHFDPNTEDLPLGTYSVNIFFEKANYTSSQTSFTFEIHPIPTSLNDTTISEIPYEINCYSSFILDLRYFKTFEVGMVNGANASYIVENYFADNIYTGELNEISDGLYHFDPNTENLPIGTYSVTIYFEKANYTNAQTSFTILINEIPFLLSFEGGTVDDENNLSPGAEFNLVTDDIFYFGLNILDVYGHPVQECNVSYRITKDDQIWLEGYLLTDNLGHYFGNFSKMEDVGLYSFTLSIQKTNYSTQTILIHLSVDYPTVFGISLPYLIIGATMTLIAASVVAGYVGIRQARIPRYIKDLTKLEKILKNPKNILPDRYLTRIEQLKDTYGNRWEQVDILFPLKQQNDEILPFIKAYQTATGRMLLNYEAKQYLDDLVIYSDEEIRARLQTEHIPKDHVSILVEIILTYSRTVNSGHKIMIDSKIDDDFDLDDLQLTTKGDE